jgi:hypothetical protein
MFLAILVAIVVSVIAFVVIMERGQRRIQVQYAKRVVGRQMFGGSANYLPLRINSAGVIPPIFASSILMFPSQIAGMTGYLPLQTLSNALRYDGWLYITVFVALVIFFTFFYTSLQFNPVDVADNLKKQNASIPGIRPGKADRRVHRLHPDAADLRRGLLHRRRLRPADLPADQVQRAVLLRRHLAADRRGRRPRHGPADREPSGHAQLRGLRRAGRAAYPRAPRLELLRGPPRA